MDYEESTSDLVPEGNPLPGDDPDVTSPVGDPVPTEPSDPGGEPTF